MRYYPSPDPFFYTEIPHSWSLFCQNPKKRWKIEPLESKHFISYWRDLEGEKLPRILRKDLEVKGWTETRIRYPACLPQYYCVGSRFVRLEKAGPASFKCATVPMNLTEVRQLRDLERNMAIEAKKQQKLASKLAKESLSKKNKTKK